MIEWIKKQFAKYEDIIKYLFFGVLATIVNIVVYYVFANVLEFHYMVANVIAWVVAVLFAYTTNRTWVFVSQIKDLRGICKEFMLFISCRIATLFLELAIMYVMISLMGIDDMITKYVCQVVVIVSNYVFSKLIIFRK